MDEHMAFYSKNAEADYKLLSKIEELIKSLQEEPVSEDLEKEIQKTIHNHFLDLNGIVIAGTSVYATVDDMVYIAKHFANWQAEQFEKERLKHCDELTPEQAQIESEFVTQHLKKNNRTPTFIDAIEYGMDSMEQQIKYQLDLRLPETLNYNGLEVSRVDVINDIIKAMKHE